MELTIYWDVLLIINLVMNYLLLWTTGRLVNIDYKIWRLILSAVVGTAYTILMLFPQLQNWNNIIIYFLISILMVIIAYFPLRIRRFIQALGYFYLITFLAAGILMAGYNLNLQSQFTELNEGFNLSIQDTWIFLIGIIFLGVLGKFSWRLFQGQVSMDNFLTSLIIKFDDEELEVNAYVDTGNQLRDPLTNLPVIIIELELLLEILPKKIRKIFTNYDLKLQIEEVATVLSETTWANRFRLIPFSVVGSQNELMIGLKPDKVIIYYQEEKLVTDHVILGVYDQPLDQDADYNALVNPELINTIR